MGHGMYRLNTLELLLKIITLVVPVIANVAFVTLLERKILGDSQIRLGPNKVEFIGLLQPFRDAIKLFLKQFETNYNTNKYIFIIDQLLCFLSCSAYESALPLFSRSLCSESDWLFF